MQWSMPRRVLQVVAGLIVFVALGAFTLGVVNAPQRGRMPGEKVEGQSGATPLAATEATPLSQDRIEGTAPRELTDEEKEKAQEEKEARQEAADAAKAAAETTTPPGVVAAAPTPAAPPPAEPPPPAPSPDEAPH